MTTLTLNFNDDEMKLINEYMKANKISLADLPSIFTSFLTIGKYNDETLEAMKEAEKIAKDSNIKGYKNTAELYESLGI